VLFQFRGVHLARAARSFRQAVASVVILVVWTGPKRIEGKVQRLLARFLAGRLRVHAAARSGGGRWGGKGNTSGLPLRFGWLLQMVPYEAANFASRLRHTLAEP
jgi:hypothetical protein